MEREQIHPAHIRRSHWINAALIAGLVWSGFSMFWGERMFAPIVRALPAGFWNAFALSGHTNPAHAWHLGFAAAFIANGLAFALRSLQTGSWKRLTARVHPQVAYHAPQRLAYVGVLGLAGMMVATGLLLWFKGPLAPAVRALGGERVLMPVHVVLACAILAFVAVHVVQVLRAGLPTLLGMIVGTSAPAPPQLRRGLAATVGVVAALLVGVAAARATSGPNGIPPYLRWAAPAHGREHAVRPAASPASPSARVAAAPRPGSTGARRGS